MTLSKDQALMAVLYVSKFAGCQGQSCQVGLQLQADRFDGLGYRKRCPSLFCICRSSSLV